MGIEILENTLLQLLVRRGTDFDRQQITLNSGELGFTTDTKRLYVGDGTTVGGILVGNKYKGSETSLVTLAPVSIGDYAYDTDNNTFYVCVSGVGAEADNWQAVATKNSAADETISIDSTQGLAVGTISAVNTSADLVGESMIIDSNGRMSLSATITVDRINQQSADATSYLRLPAKVGFNNIDYTFPGGAPQKNTFLESDAAGNLAWGNPNILLTGVAPTTAALIPVGTIVPYVSTAGNSHFPNGWLPCDGREVLKSDYPELSAIINTQYGGTISSFNVPNYTNRALYGSSDPFNSSLYEVVTGNDDVSNSSLLSASGALYIIKAVGGVTSPTLTIGKNISAFINNVNTTDITFNPLSGDIRIERATPGMSVFSTAGTFAGGFQMPDGIEFVKFYVTGTGATGGNKIGGAASTVTGYMSAPGGTTFTVTVGQAPTTINTNGNLSLISKDGGNLAVSNGGQYTAGNIPLGGEGDITLGSEYVLNGHILSGGYGSVIQVGGGCNACIAGQGTASFWGSAPAPGAGAAGSNGIGPPTYPVGDGLVKFEW
tara:strand:- start:4669 stop:6309 length:1641 start_codon:yes stop_codon:yes gene_type:complete